MTAPAGDAGGPRRELGVFDSVCIIVGIIVGSGIFQTPSVVAGCVPNAAGLVGVWLLGGLFSLAGALCYAELAGAYPRQGGEVVYLGRAYGRWAGFLFGWAQAFVILPGGIASIALIFADYAGRLAGLPSSAARFVAAGAIAVFTAVHLSGIRGGKWVQNALAALKVAGLLLAVAASFLASGRGAAPAPPPGGPAPSGWGLALILVLFTYGGWSEISFVAGEVRDPGRNFVRAMLGGIGTVTALYLLVNLAFLSSLGLAGMTASRAVAVDAVARIFPEEASRGIAALVGVSTLGALSGLIFTGSRIPYVLGTGHRALAFLGRWDPRRGVPAAALLLQGGLGVALVLGLGSFVEVVTYSAPVVWAFYLATGIGLFVLRRRDPSAERPYRVSGYPVTPAVFCASSAFLLYSSVEYAFRMGTAWPLVSVGVALAGIPVWGLLRRGSPGEPEAEGPLSEERGGGGRPPVPGAR